MRITRKVTAVLFALVIATSAMVLPASAQVPEGYYSDFSRFPGVWRSSDYAVAAVAVQKFLMLYGDSYAQRLWPNGAADGKCGDSTVWAIQTFQSREGLHTENDREYGKVDTITWQRIGQRLLARDLNEDLGAAIFYHPNRSYRTELDVDDNLNVIICTGGYYAIDHKMKQSDYPFYTP